MVLNRLFISFFLVSFLAGLYQLIFQGNFEVFPAMMNSTFDMAKVGFEISIGLTGVLTLWLGIMKIGEDGGFINIIARTIAPFFNKLFPEIPENHPVFQMRQLFHPNRYEPIRFYLHQDEKPGRSPSLASHAIPGMKMVHHGCHSIFFRHLWD